MDRWRFSPAWARPGFQPAIVRPGQSVRVGPVAQASAADPPPLRRTELPNPDMGYDEETVETVARQIDRDLAGR
jgi:hypothetical protein